MSKESSPRPELNKPHFESVQMFKMRMTALMMEYMVAFGQDNPDKMNNMVSEMRGMLNVLAEISHKVRVVNDQKGLNKPKNNS